MVPWKKIISRLSREPRVFLVLVDFEGGDRSPAEKYFSWPVKRNWRKHGASLNGEPADIIVRWFLGRFASVV